MSPLNIFLDSVWQFLSFGTVAVTASLALAGMLLKLIPAAAPLQRQKIWKAMLLQMGLTLCFAFGALLLQRQFGPLPCFESFQAADAWGFTRALAALWSLGVILGLCKDLWSYRQMRVSRQRRFACVRPEVEARLREMAAQCGLRRSFKVSSSHEPVSPYVLDLSQPEIVLPVKFLENLSAADLEPVLAHELMHLLGRDAVWNLLLHLLQRLFFFHPLLPWARRWQEDVCEGAADFQSLRLLGLSPAQYARSFFRSLELIAQPAPPLAVAASGRFRRLQRRLLALPSYVQPRSPRALLGLLFGWLALALVFSWSLVEAHSAFTPATNSVFNERMCLQAQHERVLERILKVQPTVQNKCE